MEGDLSADGLAGFDYDPGALRYNYGRASWPMQIPMTGEPNASRTVPQSHHANANYKRPTTPLQTLQNPSQVYDQPLTQPQAYIPDWRLQQPQSQLGYQLDGSFPQDAAFSQQYLTETYAMPYQTSPTDYASTQGQYDSTLAMDGSYVPLPSQMDGNISFDWQDFSNNLMAYPMSNGLPDMTLPLQNLPSSPTDNSVGVRSLSSSDNGWNSVEFQRQALDNAYQDPQMSAIFNPEQTLHGRTFSDSSNSDAERQSRRSWSSWEYIPPHAIGSPGSDSFGEMDHFHHDSTDQGGDSPLIKQEKCQHSPLLPILTSTSSGIKPIKIKTSSSPQHSPTSPRKRSPPGKRQPKKKDSNEKASKPTIRRQSALPKAETEKRVGRRKGPLKPEQRKQASEIRKLGACLRCKYLKKTCDAGEPCFGCRPSHARLWQVPCSRTDIKDLGYFMKDWKADCERHVSLGFSVANIRGYGEAEQVLFVTHGYGHMLPIKARQIFVRDESCFGLDWVETIENVPSEHSVNTAKLSAGIDGISRKTLHEYLDHHLTSDFEQFVDEYFDGTPFLSDMLITAFHYWQSEGTPVIKKSLKLLLAYNLTQHITMVEGMPDEEGFLGRIDDPDSKFYGRTVAPVMINFEIKCAMAELWRELQREILDELSHLFSSVYSKDKLKHWPTIFMVCSILLAVWEEMQFDCHYRIPDKEQVSKFCHDMEILPVAVIVGLFSAVSTKVPTFQEWETEKHHQFLGSNVAVCRALTETRQHITRHDKYLRSRCETAAFDRDDFDSLSNKFTSKLVIRASAC